MTDIWYWWGGDSEVPEKVQGRKSCSSSDPWVKEFGRACNWNLEGCHFFGGRGGSMGVQLTEIGFSV